MGVRQFYVYLRGLPADSLFWKLCKDTPRDVTDMSEIEHITALARS